MSESLVKPIVAILTGDTDLMNDAITCLEEHFGSCDFRSQWYSWNHSNYYEAEMGKGLQRSIISFEKLVYAYEAPNLKACTAAVEKKFSDEHGRRRVNCDPGYVDHLKVTLVSGKCGGHKVGIAPGVWIDYLLWYNKGWQAFPWSFPDFRDGIYFRDFTQIRKLFKAQACAG